MECTQVLLSESLNDVNTATEKHPVASLLIGDKYYTIFNTENVIGRENICDVVICNNAVSSKHAVIEAEDPDGHLIYDLGSTNKTRLGKMVLKPHVRYHINDGDCVTFGNVSAQYNISRQYPTTPVKEECSLNKCSIPETPEYPEQMEQSTGRTSETVVKADSSSLDASDNDIFDEKEDSSAVQLKGNLNRGVKGYSDIYELDTLSFDEKIEIDIGLVTNQDSNINNEVIKKNVKIKSAVDLNVYDVTTQDPADDSKNLPNNLPISGKEKFKSNYDWEDFPDIDSPVGLDTSNADDLDYPKSKLSSSLMEITTDDLKRNHSITKNAETEIRTAEGNTNDSTPSVDDKTHNLSPELVRSSKVFETATTESENNKNYIIRTEQFEDNFYIPLSQNADMFESSPEKVRCEIPDQDDVYEMLTQASSENENNPNESIYDIQTQLADVSDESMRKVTVQLKKNDYNALIQQNQRLSEILEPATQPYNNKEDDIVTSTSFASIKVVDETDQDCTFSASIYEAATQPYPHFNEQKSVSNTEVSSKKILNDNDDDIKNGSVINNYEAATQKYTGTEKKDDHVVFNDANLVYNTDKPHETKENCSFSDSIYEAATQPCPRSPDQKSHTHANNLQNEMEINGKMSVVIEVETKKSLVDQGYPLNIKDPFMHKSNENSKKELILLNEKEDSNDCPQSSVKEKDEIDPDISKNLVMEIEDLDMLNEATQPYSKDVSQDKVKFKDQLLSKEIIGKDNSDSMKSKEYLLNVSVLKSAIQPSSNNLGETSNQGTSCIEGAENFNKIDIRDIDETEAVKVDDMTQSFFEAATQPVPNFNHLEMDKNLSDSTLFQTSHLELINNSNKSISNNESKGDELVNVNQSVRHKEETHPLSSDSSEKVFDECEKEITSIGNSSVDKFNSVIYRDPIGSETQSAPRHAQTSVEIRNENICEIIDKDHQDVIKTSQSPSNNVPYKETSPPCSFEDSKSSINVSYKTGVPNSLSDSFFEAATQPYQCSELENKTFLDPLSSICNDLSEKKICEITDELMYGNISTSLQDKNVVCNAKGLSNACMTSKQQNVEMSDNNIYEALNNSFSSPNKPSTIEKNHEHPSNKISTQDLKKLLESDDLTQKYDDFKQINISPPKSNKKGKHNEVRNDSLFGENHVARCNEVDVKDKEKSKNESHIPVVTSNKETVSLIEKNVDKSFDETALKKKRKDKGFIKKCGSLVSTCNDSDSSQEFNVRSNKKRCNVFPPDSQNLDSICSENDNKSQEFSIRSTKKRCTLFPSDSQESIDKEIGNVGCSPPKPSSSMKKNSTDGKVTTEAHNFDSVHSERDNQSQEVFIRSKKKRNVFPPDSLDINEEILNEHNLSPKPSSSGKSNSGADSKVSAKNAQENYNNSGRGTELKNKRVLKGKCSEKPSPPKKNSKESKNLEEREPIFISRGNITIHSPEVLCELEEQFRLTKGAMSPTQLSVVSDIEEETNSSQEVSDTPSKQGIRRSVRNQKHVPFKKVAKTYSKQVKSQSCSLEPDELTMKNNENKKKPGTSSLLPSKFEKSFKKFKKVSPVKTSPIKDKEEKLTIIETDAKSHSNSCASSEPSPNSEELGRGKRKRIRPSYEGFILEEDIKRTPRKKSSFSQDDDVTNRSIAKTEFNSSKGGTLESQNEVTNESFASSIKNTVKIVLQDIRKSPLGCPELLESCCDKNVITIPKEKETLFDEELVSFSTSSKKSIQKISLTDDKLTSKSKKIDKSTIKDNNSSFSFTEKLDELFNIWGPADRVKLSPRVAKKQYRWLLNGKTQDDNSGPTSSSRKKSCDNVISKTEANHSAVNESKTSVGKKHALLKDSETNTASSSTNSRKKLDVTLKNEESEPPTKKLQFGKKRRKTNSENSENSVDLNKIIGNDNNSRKSSRISGKKNVEVTNKDLLPQISSENISDKCTRSSKGDIDEENKQCDRRTESIINNVHSTKNSSSKLQIQKETLMKAPPLNVITRNSKSNPKLRKKSNPEKELPPSSALEENLIFSQEFSFHAEKGSKERKLSNDNSLPPPLKVRRSSRKKNEKVVQKSFENVMFTGFSDKTTISHVDSLGGQVVDSPFTCTVLVTDKVRRTTKFLSALSRGLPIVSPQWLVNSKQNGMFLDVNDFLLSDKESEALFSFNLKKSIEKAQNSKLLVGWTIFVTPSVKPSPSEMKSIIECSGGRFLAKEVNRWPANSLIISCEEDRALWDKFSKKTKGPIIVDNEAILLGVLRQELNLEPHRLM